MSLIRGLTSTLNRAIKTPSLISSVTPKSFLYHSSHTTKTSLSSILLPTTLNQVRFLNLHEFQSKELMKKYGVATQQFGVAETADEALAIAKGQLAGKEVVVKAQVHAGGRGKGVFEPNGFKGGVHVIAPEDVEKVKDVASKMLGQNLITKQTPPAGVLVNKLMVAESVDIYDELYFAILLDREFMGPVMIASTEGGVDIEDVAERTPELIHKQPIDIFTGLTDDQALAMATKLKFTGDKAKELAGQLQALYELFANSDATQVEINPLAQTNKGIIAIDAKIGFDDNAEFRQKEIFAQADTKEEDPTEVEANAIGLNYIKMDGSIGCLVNGAGLAMATMDIITQNGGSPANFLDVGGGANEEMIAEAFRLITADPGVKGVLVNIFGGIMRCDIIAKGVVAASKKLELSVPVVVRLAGTNVEEGERILRESGLDLIPAADLDDAAAKIVQQVS